MQRSEAVRHNPASDSRSSRWMKIVLWTLIGISIVSVTLYSEIPLLRQAKERAYLRTIPWLILPHICGGVFALLCGPLQFLDRLRQRHLGLHKILGRAYVTSVFVAAPLAILLSVHRHDPKAIHFAVATCCQAGTWLVATAVAFLAARNGHILQHREWAVRSYALTLTFVGTRVLQPIPAWNRHSESGFAMEILIITLLAILIPDLALHWEKLTTKRSDSKSTRSQVAVSSLVTETMNIDSDASALFDTTQREREQV